jgi:serine/threonine protein kinase
MSMLRLLHTLRHPNIVPLLGSYTYKDEHNLLFPYFEMDLEKFLNKDIRTGEFNRDSTFYFALYGLASALEHTHSLHLEEERNGLKFDAIGYHKDFRPANILVSKDSFILADFGLGQFKPTPVESETVWKKGIGDYIAPECRDIAFNPQAVGRAIDVWAFGCLVTEVITYMQQGPEGIRRFRELRREELIPGWILRCFHDATCQLKATVRNWLNDLEQNSSESPKRILQVAIMALESNPKVRPPISRIRSDLAIPTLRALLHEALDIFRQYRNSSLKHNRSLSMKLWFQEEQIRAFEGALSPNFDNDGYPLRASHLHDKCCNALKAIFGRVESELNSLGTPTPSNPRTEILHDCRGPFEDQIQLLVDTLWNQLSSTYARRATVAWFESMQIKDMERLEKLKSYSQSHQQENAVEMGARARMKEMLLRIQNDPTTGAAEFLHARRGLSGQDFSNGHLYGRFRGKQFVLVEWMYYRPGHNTVSADQRIQIMQLRAKNFGIIQKPSGLRTLKCLGLVEEPHGDDDMEDGYGFLYELPESGGDKPLVTLRHLLSKSEREPDLDAKFQLAHSLALFFEEFHLNGWLHENFNSNNVVFARDPSERDHWGQPYVVGLQKSRPDGQDWETYGPTDETKSQKFEQHPDYLRRGRFAFEYDYYSLGLVLVEIGGWTPLEKLFTKSGYKQDYITQLEDFRTFLRDKYAPRLAIAVGKIYRDVVRRCLDGSLEQDGKSSPAAKDRDKSVYFRFIKEVALPLEELSNICI